MSHRYNFLITAAVALLISACATPTPRNHIDQAARSHFNAVDTYLVVEQDNIVAGKFRSEISGGSGLGFLQILAMESVQQSIEEKTQASVDAFVEPIRENLKNYDFAAVLSNKLNAALGEIEWLNAKDPVLLRKREKDLFLIKSASSRSSATLFVGAQYWISPDLSHVKARVESIMFPNVESLEAYKAEVDGNENPVDITDNIYFGKFMMRVPLKVEGLVKDRVSKLAHNDGEKVKSALTKCAAMVADYLGRDLERDEKADLKKQ